MRTFRRSAAMVFVATLCACGGSSGGGSDGGFGLERRTQVAPLPLPFGLPQPGPAAWQDAFPALVFDRPLALAPVPGNRLVVAEQAGRLLVFDNDPGTTSTRTFLDLRNRVQSGGEEGLLGLAFHPDYTQNGWLYVYYTAGAPRRSVLARFTVSSDPNIVDPLSELVLLEIPQPFDNHNAGCLQFGPDGKLYVASGDGGGGNDPLDAGQSLATVLGKILRLNGDGSIPDDNPFANGPPGTRPEIWAYGLRNPWRMSFDAAGRLWVGDVGQSAEEEIDLIERGGNYGWPVFEGNRSNRNPAGVPATAFQAPVHTYGRSDGVSVTGGHVYRGASVPALRGAYVYADFGSGNVWALVYDGIQQVQNTMLANLPNPASFGEDADGELYACCFDGRIRRLVPNAAPGPVEAMPALLSATGLFGSTAALEPTAGVLEYGINSEFWADGAGKRRWLALPGSAQLRPQADGSFGFPIGTALVKHFAIEVEAGVERRLETRLLLHQVDGWRGYSYRWNDSGTDAELVAGAGLDVPFEVRVGGQVEARTWRYPSRSECLQCHTAAAGRVLGVTVPQLNRQFAFPRRTADQLGTWQYIGLFAAPLGAAATLPTYFAADDASASLDDRARSWLDTNCAFCHRPGGPTPVDLDLRFVVAGADLRAFGVPAVSSIPGGSGLRVVAGNHTQSELWQRLLRRDGFGMPPLGTFRVDPAVTALLAPWIDAGQPPR